MKISKKLFLLFVIIFVIPSIVSAGMGARFGFSKDTEDNTYDESMTLIGVDYRFSAFPIVDVIGTIEYSWKKYTVTGTIPVEGTRHFLTINASVVKPFKIAIVKPYAGIGYGFHVIGGTLSIMGNPAGGSAITGTGFHIIGGIKVAPPAFPLSVYGEYRQYWTNFDVGNGKYYTLSVGAMLGF